MGKTITLKIGDVAILENNEDIIWTVLGSCISVIFHIGGKLSIASHAQLPNSYGGAESCKDDCPNPCRRDEIETGKYKYVNCSVKYMLEELEERGIPLHYVEATLIGGASVLSRTEEDSIGTRNIRSAAAILEKSGINNIRNVTGGKHGITLWYYSESNRLIIMRHNEKKKYEVLKNGKLKEVSDEIIEKA